MSHVSRPGKICAHTAAAAAAQQQQQQQHDVPQEYGSKGGRWQKQTDLKRAGGIIATKKMDATKSLVSNNSTDARCVRTYNNFRRKISLGFNIGGNGFDRTNETLRVLNSFPTAVWYVDNNLPKKLLKELVAQ